MTTEEFSNEFDVLVDSYRRFKDFDSKENLDSLEFSEYEKSIFLTEAQESIIMEYYNGKNYYGDSFEKTEEIRRSLDALVKTQVSREQITPKPTSGLSSKSVFYNLPANIWFITYESITFDDSSLGCKNGTLVPVIPVKQDDFYRICMNPFKKYNKRRALRLDVSSNIVEILSNYNIGEYLIRYIEKPSPIILVNLPDNIFINGVNTITECALNTIIHRTILERAVKKALISKISNINKQA